MLGKLFDNILREDEGVEINKVKKDSADIKKRKVPWLSIILIFVIALIPRLLYIFKFGNPNFPGWYTDTFHHWQQNHLYY